MCLDKKNVSIVFVIVLFLWATGSVAVGQTVLWSEDFEDGNVNDWQEINKQAPPATKEMIIECSQDLSTGWSLKVSSPASNSYGGYGWGPAIPIVETEPYQINFSFRYGSFHWYHLMKFGPVHLTMDYSSIKLRYYNGTTWDYLGNQSFGSYCPKNTWTRFRIDVFPASGTYDVYVDDIFRGTADPKGWDGGRYYFQFVECPHPAVNENYVTNGYYDDISVIGIDDLVWDPRDHDFGDVAVGQQSSNFSFTLTNKTSGNTSGTVSTTGDFLIAGSSSYNLSSGDSAVFDVYFEPTTIGPRQGTLEASSLNQPVANLVGNGLYPIAVLEWDPPSHNFGMCSTRTPSDNFEFTLTNTGDAATSGTVSTTGSFYIDGNTSYNIGPGDSALFNVYAQPLQVGQFSGVLHAGSANQPVAILTGTASMVPYVDVKVNGEDGNLTIPIETSAKIDYKVIAGGGYGYGVDIWLAVLSPSGTYYCYVGGPNPWRMGLTSAMYTGPLDDMSGTCVDLILPSGPWIVYLAIDPYPDGVLQMGAIQLLDKVVFECL